MKDQYPDWLAFGRELRLKFADENVIGCHERGLSHQMKDGTCSDCGWEQNPAITAALAYMNEVNASHNQWASIEILRFEHDMPIRVEVGTLWYKGTENERKEIAIKTRSYYYRDGKVDYYDAAHL